MKKWSSINKNESNNNILLKHVLLTITNKIISIEKKNNNILIDLFIIILQLSIKYFYNK